MTILYILIPAALALAFFFLGAFLWATHRGQFDDLVTPAHRILMDDIEQNPTQTQSTDETTTGGRHV